MNIPCANADQFCSAYEHARAVTLARCIADRALDLAACADVNRMGGTHPFHAPLEELAHSLREDVGWLQVGCSGPGIPCRARGPAPPADWQSVGAGL
jgi:hypothetical protein